MPGKLLCLDAKAYEFLASRLERPKGLAKKKREAPWRLETMKPRPRTRVGTLQTFI